jgi:FAD/FMN-containing dehydrogenase
MTVKLLSDELESSLSAGSAILRDADCAAYGSDWSSAGGDVPALVVLPASIDDVVTVVRWAGRHSIPLVPSGGRTGLSGGAVARGCDVVVGLERMRRILATDVVERTMTVQAGATTQMVQDVAKASGLLYPVDFASRGSSQIGGNIATNAGGVKVIRYGLTRDWVVGLKMVAGNGVLLDLNRGLVKNASGYDLRHVIIGSEGTLGIVVEATLKLTALPAPQQVMLLALPSMSVIMDAYTCLRRTLSLSAFEFFTHRALMHVLAAGGRAPFAMSSPCYVLVECDLDEAAVSAAFEDLVSSGLATDAVLARSEAEAVALWQLREGITESLSHRRPYKNDVSVRPNQMPEFMRRVDALFDAEYPEFEVIWFGHVGDGNLHVSVLPPEGYAREAFVSVCEHVTHMLGELLQEFGGSVSAEHGIGLLKHQYLHYTRPPAEIEMMRQMKRVFDPAGIMNPGKLFPP